MRVDRLLRQVLVCVIMAQLCLEKDGGGRERHSLSQLQHVFISFHLQYLFSVQRRVLFNG